MLFTCFSSILDQVSAEPQDYKIIIVRGCSIFVALYILTYSRILRENICELWGSYGTEETLISASTVSHCGRREKERQTDREKERERKKILADLGFEPVTSHS